MDDFSQIVGIVLAMVFFLYSAFKKKNKKSSTPINAIINDIIPQDTDQSEHKPESSKQDNKDEKTCFKTHQSTIGRKHVDRTDTMKVRKQEPKTVDNEKNGNRFNLKQAVIYSELLNRKYF